MKNRKKKIEMNKTDFIGVHENIIGFENGDAVGFINIDNGQKTFHYILSEDSVTGITCIAGNKTESIFALGCICNSVPLILIYSYPDIQCIGHLNSNNIFLNFFFSFD